MALVDTLFPRDRPFNVYSNTVHVLCIVYSLCVPSTGSDLPLPPAHTWLYSQSNNF